VDFGRVWVIVNPCVGGDDSVGLTVSVLGFVFVWC
jgi:hypothetical protein